MTDEELSALERILNEYRDDETSFVDALNEGDAVSLYDSNGPIYEITVEAAWTRPTSSR